MSTWLASLKRPLQIGLTAAVLTGLVTLFMPNYYRSEARVLPVDAKGSSGGLGNLATAAAAFGLNVPIGDSADANFVDILQSRTVFEQLLKTTFTFHESSWRFGPKKEISARLETYLKVPNSDRAIQRLGEILAVSRDPKSKVILLKAETKSPELSQELVRESLRLLEDFVQQKGRTRGGAKATFAEARLGESRKEMFQAEEELRRFLEGNRNYLMSADPSVRLTGMRLEAELKLRQQLVATLALSREQALMEEKNDIPILNVLDPGNLPIEKSKPNRTAMVLIVLVLTVGTAWTWQNREAIKARLFAIDDEDENSLVSNKEST